MIFTHSVCLEHDPGPGHPESPERLHAVLEALAAPEFERVQWREAPRASREQLQRAHDPALLDLLFDNAPREGYLRIDADTVMSPASLEAALRAAGAACAATDSVVGGEARSAFCAVRPPGHHATRAVAMGFCLFNSVAVAAHHALQAHGLQRIAIVDFDVHHGNGTQDVFWKDPRVLYVSSHQSPLYPGTGSAAERGVGNILNAPLPGGAGSQEFRAVYERDIFPALEAFSPELLLVSAGFDAHRLDPLAGMNLASTDYGWVTRGLVEMAGRHASGRVVSCLEGGYSLTALREGVTEHCRAMFGTNGTA